MQTLTLNQNIEIIDTAVSQHLSEIKGDFVFHRTYETNVIKQYRLSYYVDHQDGSSVAVYYDGLVLHSSEIDDLGWINLRALSESKTEIRIIDGFIESSPDISPNENINQDINDFEVRLKTKEALVNGLIDRLGVDGFLEDEGDKITNSNFQFVSRARIKDLKLIHSDAFDLSKLIKLCEEINDNYGRGNYFSVAMLTRAISDHIPPIFGLKDFAQVSSNYGGTDRNRSFKKNMGNLQNSLKNIADGHLHEQIRKREALPNQTQINFSADLDVLLAEIVRILK